jgi:hypothetical protein
VIENFELEELKKCLENLEETYRAIRIAVMDLAYGAEPASEEYAPVYAVQWYTTQLET